MARLNDEAQWIVLMGFIVSFALFFLAIIVNQSVVVGQTTAEAVSEFPKNDIRSVRDVIIQSSFTTDAPIREELKKDIMTIELNRKGGVVNFSVNRIDNFTYIEIHYNNGVTEFNELRTYP